MKKIKVNPDKRLVANINRKLYESKINYGEKYCPCSLLRNKDTICMCKEFKENEELDICHCGKYIRVEETEQSEKEKENV